MSEPASGLSPAVVPRFAEGVARAFAERFGQPAALLVRAPGRVNLLGEHTDYNEGFVLPMAIDRSAWIALRPRGDRRVVARSLDFGEEQSFELDDLERGPGGWIEYVKGTAWALAEAGAAVGGWEGVIAGEVPLGAGLSSSAALEIAVVRAFLAASGLPWDPVAAARHAQRAENGWVGVRCGIMDPLIIAAAVADHALLIDCRDLHTSTQPLPPGTAVAILDTSTRRGLAHSAYNDRRERCEEAARVLGVGSLREVSVAELDRRWPELAQGLAPLVRHVVTENARTLAAAEAMRAGDARRLGELMREGHRSLREDFRVSSDALDAMVAAATEAPGCFGARMTGAGFGGCVVALIEEDAAAEFPRIVESAYRKRTGLKATVYVTRPSPGAGVMELG
ncbi:MAG TPA: galactokinase [Vicinamibacteria bacterium]